MDSTKRNGGGGGGGVYPESYTRGARFLTRWDREGEKECITSSNRRGKHNLLSRGGECRRRPTLDIDRACTRTTESSLSAA